MPASGVEVSADVVVVGARVAGAALAAHLAAAGVDVLAIESEPSSKSPSKPCQVIQADALARLDALGALEAARPHAGHDMSWLDLRIGNLRLKRDFPVRAGDQGSATFIQHVRLAEALSEVLDSSGARIERGAGVVGLVTENGRTAGVQLRRDGELTVVRSRLVVGADGRRSPVARWVGSRKYHRTRTDRVYFWGYFSDARPGRRPAFVTHRWNDRFYWAGPVADGGYMVGASHAHHTVPDMARPTPHYVTHVMECEPLAEVLADATLLGPPGRAARIESYFREGAGRGWALVGDAGHFKDPLSGRGIGDALTQAESLAKAIAIGLGRSDRHLDATMRRWWRARDDHFLAHYWLTVDLASLDPFPATVMEVFRWLDEQDRSGELLEILSHRNDPTDLVTARRMVSASLRLARGGGSGAGALWADLRAVVGRELARRRLHLRPEFVTS